MYTSFVASDRFDARGNSLRLGSTIYCPMRQHNPYANSRRTDRPAVWRRQCRHPATGVDNHSLMSALYGSIDGPRISTVADRRRTDRESGGDGGGLRHQRVHRRSPSANILASSWTTTCDVAISDAHTCCRRRVALRRLHARLFANHRPTGN